MLSIVNPVDAVPVGTVALWPGAKAPDGWRLLDGSEYLRSSELYSVLGTTYGAGDGSTTANLPDMRQRFPMGKAASGTGAVLGSAGGSIDHTHGSPLTTGAPSATVAATVLAGGAASPTHTHSVAVPAANPPFLVLNFIVKL